jgi:uncharacterized membrane protein YuzA (DUF378 family)
MTPAARSVGFFGAYLGILAIVLLLAPNVLLALVGLPPTSEVWTRVVRMLVGFLGVYYVTAAANEMTTFFRATVPCRLAVPIVFLLFVAAGWVRWPLALFGVVDAVGAGWTWRTLRRSLPQV